MFIWTLTVNVFHEHRDIQAPAAICLCRVLIHLMPNFVFIFRPNFWVALCPGLSLQICLLLGDLRTHINANTVCSIKLVCK
jgi:hypothetical protein